MILLNPRELSKEKIGMKTGKDYDVLAQYFLLQTTLQCAIPVTQLRSLI